MRGSLHTTVKWNGGRWRWRLYEMDWEGGGWSVGNGEMYGVPHVRIMRLFPPTLADLYPTAWILTESAVFGWQEKKYIFYHRVIV